MLLRFAYFLFDPRGRVDRLGLLGAAIGLLTAQVGFFALLQAGVFSLHNPVAIAIKLLFVYVALVMASKRLHDLNRSAWWIAAAFAGLFVLALLSTFLMVFAWGPRQLLPGSVGYGIVLASNFVPTLAATLWLHFAKGAQGENRYGAAPGHLGFSEPQADIEHRAALA